MFKVSIIVPVYNVNIYLNRCVRSVLEQTYSDFELILIDDGAIDGSARQCDFFQELDNRIIVVHKTNGGVSSARNAALQLVTGDYIMFLDGDDAFDVKTLEVCVGYLKDGLWDMVLFGFHMYIEDCKKITFQGDIKYCNETIVSKTQLDCNFSNYYKKGYFNFITDKIIKASLILDNLILFNDEYNIGGEDAIFILDLIKHVNRLKVTSNVFYKYYRRSHESITQTFKSDKFDRYYNRVKRIYEHMRSINCIDYEYLVKLYGLYFLWAYESTFYASAKFSLLQRFKYVINIFNKDDIFTGQKSVQIKTCLNLSYYSQFSKSSLFALKLFFKRKFVLLGILNLLSYFKMRFLH